MPSVEILGLPAHAVFALADALVHVRAPFPGTVLINDLVDAVFNDAARSGGF